ncbi:expressed unknown protein [Seminavis robusta]|uniref:Uncharacterized protein n=1 Tax=Seminavis robusta TaxID=568900 RepID=A0A9N8HU09_9STRA|nr:expressed unknown protein [Seminavis robusta]|eukprot:Sro1583_g283940.1 n/a (730) ;mRNA; r:9367-11556
MTVKSILLFSLLACHQANGQNIPFFNGDPNFLFLGNSYTGYNSLSQTFKSIVEDGIPAWRNKVLERSINPGGKTLNGHLQDAENPSSDSAQREALITKPEPWKWATLQDQSQVPGFYEWDWAGTEFFNSRTAAVELNDLIGGLGGQTMFLMTWGRRQGDLGNDDIYPDFETMQARITTGYYKYVNATTTASRRTYVAPAGLVFETIYNDEIDQGIDPLSFGTLFRSLYQADGSHPAVAGTYVAALTLYTSMTGLSPKRINWFPDTLEPADGRKIQDAVSRTILETFYSGEIIYPWDKAFPDQAPGTPLPTSAPVTPVPTSRPSLRPTTPSPVTPAPTTAPPTQAPVSPSPTQAPVSPSPTQAPVSPAPTQAPVSPSPTQAPVSPSPTQAPVSPSPTQAPVSPSPTKAPVSPSPTQAPVSPAPTTAPVSPPTTPNPTLRPTSPPQTPDNGNRGSIEVRFKMDEFSDQISWSFKGEDYGYLKPFDNYITPFEGVVTTFNDLKPGQRYFFKISDSNGDGICCDHGKGFFSITDKVSGRNLYYMDGVGFQAYLELVFDILPDGSATITHKSGQYRPTSWKDLEDQLMQPDNESTWPGAFPTMERNSLVVNVDLDDHPEDVSWTVYQQIPNFEWSPLHTWSGVNATAGTLESLELCDLPPGWYRFVVQDSRKDGLCCDRGKGYVSLTGPLLPTDQSPNSTMGLVWGNKGQYLEEDEIFFLYSHSGLISHIAWDL